MDSITAKLDELFDLWVAGGYYQPDDFARDGIICENNWNSARRKILFLAKETHGECKDLRCAIEPQKWTLLGYWSYGLIHAAAGYIPSYDEAVNGYVNAVKSSAIMNLKKSAGGASTNNRELSNSIQDEDNAQRIWEQIQIINPDVVICNGTFRYVINQLPGAVRKLQNLEFEDQPKLGAYCWSQPEADRLWIDYYHFSVRCPHLPMYYGLMGIFQGVLNSSACPDRLKVKA